MSFVDALEYLVSLIEDLIDELTFRVITREQRCGTKKILD